MAETQVDCRGGGREAVYPFPPIICNKLHILTLKLIPRSLFLWLALYYSLLIDVENDYRRSTRWLDDLHSLGTNNGRKLQLFILLQAGVCSDCFANEKINMLLRLWKL